MSTYHDHNIVCVTGTPFVAFAPLGIARALSFGVFVFGQPFAADCYTAFTCADRSQLDVRPSLTQLMQQRPTMNAAALPQRMLAAVDKA